VSGAGELGQEYPLVGGVHQGILSGRFSAARRDRLGEAAAARGGSPRGRETSPAAFDPSLTRSQLGLPSDRGLRARWGGAEFFRKGCVGKHHGFSRGKRVRIKFKDGTLVIDRFVYRRMPFLFFENSGCVHVRSVVSTSHWKKGGGCL
jgi:hypothetical protein